MNHPLLDKIWMIDPKEPFRHRIALYRAIRAEHFDLVIDFQQLPRIKAAVFASCASVKLTYPPKWYNRPLYTDWSPPLPGYASKAKSGILAPLGIEWGGELPELHLTKEEKRWAIQYLAGEGIMPGTPFITIDATHRHPARKWPSRHYAELLNILFERFPKLKAFMLYGPGEKHDVDAIKVMITSPEKCVVSDHMTSLREMAAVIEQSNGQVGNCSSPRHFAVAVGTPTITLIGSTKPGGWTAPTDLHLSIRDEGRNCLGCNDSVCRYGTTACMEAVRPETVYGKLIQMFDFGR